MGVILPLAVAAGATTSLVLGLLALLFAVRAVQHETMTMGRYLFNSLRAIVLFWVLTALAMVGQIKEFEDLLACLFFLGAAPGLGLWVSYFWTRHALRQQREAEANKSIKPPHEGPGRHTP